MSKICDLLKCDCCLSEGREGAEWWQNWNGNYKMTGDDGINGGANFQHLCPNCRMALNAAVATVINERRGKHA